MMGKRAKCLMLALTVLAIFSACKTSKSQLKEDEPLLVDGHPKMCAAVRGNGHYLMTHFSSLARLVEHYGPFDGFAGGSSASVTGFIYESMLKNPLLRQCGVRACTRDEAALRLGLLLKSVIGYFNDVENSSEALAAFGAYPLLSRARTMGLGGAVAETGELREKLEALLSAEDAKEVVNPEVLAMLQVSDQLLAVRNAQEVYAGLMSFGQFSTEDQRIFLRPGLFNFKAVARKLGRVASFYAGYEPVNREAMRNWMDRCAVEEGRGLYWEQLAKSSPGGVVCGEEFSRIVVDYRVKLLENEAAFPSRVDEPVGRVIPMLLSTSIIYGSSRVADVREQLDNYLQGRPAEIKPGLSGLRFGYWGDSRSLAALEANAAGFADLRTQKRLALGTATWEEVLSLSPAEPGLARIQIMDDTKASAGGWSDLSPTLVLKMLGCEKTVYVTRRGEESPFATGVAKLLGVDDDERDDLYNLDKPTSSFSLSLREASAIWCTDWNRYSDAELAAMARESYAAPLVTQDEGFSRSTLLPYTDVQRSSEFRGCVVGQTP